MVINLNRCTGCNSCAVACKANHGLGPDLFYTYVKVGEEGTYPTAKMTVSPSICNHCTYPICVEKCPTGASWQRDDGIVLVDHDKCIGCDTCIQVCPYNVRTHVTDAMVSTYYDDSPDTGGTTYESTMYADHKVDTVEKCTFCSDRIDEGLDPLCVATCPAMARTFGDLDDADSAVSKLLADNTYTVLQPEAGTEPNVYYIG